MRLSKITDINYRNAVLDYKKEKAMLEGRETLRLALLDLRVAWYELLRAIFQGGIYKAMIKNKIKH